MGDKLVKHSSDLENSLKRMKRDFEKKYIASLKSNAQLSDFKIIKTLGTGSFGRVVLARHKFLDNKVLAIKILEKEHVVQTKQVHHTISEIRLMNAMKFEFLIKMEYFFKDNVYLFLVMQFINGGEMFSHLRNLKRFDEPLTKFYASQVILVFDYLHYIGVIYRDLKPENILIDKDGYLKITDYGFCKRLGEERTYTLCGTPEYLAPETILSQGYNKSVDWWALGVLIYEMSAGYPPFCAKDPMKIYEKIVAGKYICPAHFSKPLKDLISNILQVDRTMRYGILKNGSRDVKGHEFFKGFDWDSVLQRKCKPPYKPKVKGDADTSNFDSYDEQQLRKSSRDEYADEFRDFSL